MNLIIGLGNIGAEYADTRHNMGFMCLDRFAEKYSLSFKKNGNFYYTTYRECVLMKPATYMNLSGNAYLSAVSKFGRFDDLLVISDDIELPTGSIRIRQAGGDGGHNGLKSIISAYGSDNVPRIRIGIGRPGTCITRDYVLDSINNDEFLLLDDVFHTVVKWLNIYIRRDFTQLLNEYSKWKRQPVPPQESGIISPKEEPHD